MKAGVVLIAHGSRREEANEEIGALSRLVQEADRGGRYEVAFMQFGSPSLPEAVAKLAAQGVKQVIVMPLFLITGNHVTQDIPAELEVIKTQYPDMEFVMARHFAAHPALVQIVQERVREAVLAGERTES
ncbi:MAG: sirohydrochlorin chelatase [Syntrophomonadaceae bacterium]|jgi:sirohydrochlorin ferrochelatase